MNSASIDVHTVNTFCGLRCQARHCFSDYILEALEAKTLFSVAAFSYVVMIVPLAVDRLGKLSLRADPLYNF